jgi:hypothetical protein
MQPLTHSLSLTLSHIQVQCKQHTDDEEEALEASGEVTDPLESDGVVAAARELLLLLLLLLTNDVNLLCVNVLPVVLPSIKNSSSSSDE